LDLTDRVAADAGVLGPEFPGDPVDRIIYATTVVHGTRLVTRDSKLRRLDPVRTVW
ncbi:MAG: PIN domain-containing protein, partial [Gaiellaceae bacterium]